MDGWQLFWLILHLFFSIHVYRDCRRIGEPAWYNVTGTLIFGPLYYVPWILWWPGSLRRYFSGGSIDDLPTAKAFRRARQIRDRRIHR